MNNLVYLLLDPPPLRILIRKIIKKLKLGSYKFVITSRLLKTTLFIHFVPSCRSWKALNHKTISVVEFGVGKEMAYKFRNVLKIFQNFLKLTLKYMVLIMRQVFLP